MLALFYIHALGALSCTVACTECRRETVTVWWKETIISQCNWLFCRVYIAEEHKGSSKDHRRDSAETLHQWIVHSMAYNLSHINGIWRMKNPSGFRRYVRRLKIRIFKWKPYTSSRSLIFAQLSRKFWTTWESLNELVNKLVIYCNRSLVGLSFHLTRWSVWFFSLAFAWHTEIEEKSIKNRSATVFPLDWSASKQHPLGELDENGYDFIVHLIWSLCYCDLFDCPPWS